MSPALNGSSAIRRFKHSDVIEIRNGIIFDFYTGLPHVSRIEGSEKAVYSILTGWLPVVVTRVPLIEDCEGC